MMYHITGKFVRNDLLALPHEAYVELITTKFVPTLRMLKGESPAGRVLAGGAPAGGRDFVMIVDLNADSHRAVRQFLASLSIFEYYEWETIPLESFEEMGRAFGV